MMSLSLCKTKGTFTNPYAPAISIEDIKNMMDENFFGLLKGKPKEVKKLKVLEIYRYFCRFAIEKMKFYVDDPILMLIALQYMKQTKMRRIHKRTVLRKNIDQYYRAFENMINISPYRPILIEAIPLILERSQYDIITNWESKKEEVSLRKLQMQNVEQLAKTVDEREIG